MIDAATNKRFQAVKARLMAAVQDELKKGDVSASDMLALLAFTTGACIALQDQRKMTPAQALKLIGDNIEAGNQQVIGELARGTHGNA